MTQPEFIAWRHFRQWYGFDVDRLEAAICNAGAVTGRVSSDAIKPVFRPPGLRVSNEVKIASLSTLSGATVISGGRYRGK